MPASERLLATDLSTPLSAVVLFTASGATYRVEDAVGAAVFRNELEDAIVETLEFAGAEDLAEELDGEPDPSGIQAFSDRFRYERDLISAGETEDWIRARGLETEEFTGWMYSRACRLALPDAPPSSQLEDLHHRLHVHLWMSGHMDALDVALQRRVASRLEIDARGEQLDLAPARDAFLSRHGLDDSNVDGWLEKAGRDQSWLEEMLRLEASYDTIRQSALTPEAREREMRSLGTALARVAILTLDLESEAAAREAVLCVREDGSTLEQVAEESGFRSELTEVWLEGVEPELAQRLFSADEGEALEPVSVDGGFRVFQLVRKLEPALSDDGVLAKVDESILRQTFEALCSRHIRPSEAIRGVR